MDISKHLMPGIAADSLNALTDNRRAQMSDMQRFGNIRPAIVYHNHLRIFRHLQSEFSIRTHFLQIFFNELFRHPEVQKARRNNADFRKYCISL